VTPGAAISWATYETIKSILAQYDWWDTGQYDWDIVQFVSYSIVTDEDGIVIVIKDNTIETQYYWATVIKDNTCWEIPYDR